MPLDHNLKLKSLIFLFKSMSLRIEFEGTYEEREKQMREVATVLREKFSPTLKIKIYNPKSLGDYILLTVLQGVETGLRESGREGAHKLVNYIFDNLTKEEEYQPSKS